MFTNEWKTEAIKRFPEIPREEYVHWDTPFMCWAHLGFLFEKAYKPPRKDDLIGRIYEFAKWCIAQPRGKDTDDDLGSVVAVCFYESIPTIEEAMKDMPRWFTLEEVRRAEGIFSYQVGKEGFEKILEVYRRAQ